MSNEEMNIEEVEQRISRCLILFEGKELTKKQAITKITHIPISKGEVCDECEGEGETSWGELNTIGSDCDACKGSGWEIPPVTIEDVIKERYQGGKK